MRISKNSCNLLRRLIKGTPSNLRRFSNVSSIQSDQAFAYPSFEFKGLWPADDQKQFLKDMRVLENFLTADEEAEFLTEIEPYLKRMRYEFDHWDDAIHGFRECERKNWYPNNKATLQRLINTAFAGETLPHVHVLDLAEDGHIKPHVDAVRFCGNTIAGLSLLSDSVMRLVRTSEKDAGPEAKQTDDYSRTKVVKDDNAYFVDVLLKRHSMYIMKDTARYNYTHEILAKDFSVFQGQPVNKTRRISIICRNEPQRQ